MEAQMQQELQRVVTEWFRSKNLLNGSDVVTITISTTTAAPVTVTPHENNRADELALREVLNRMDKTTRTRVANCLTNMNITCLSQVQSRSTHKEWRTRGLARKGLSAFARALHAAGVECFVTQNYLEPDQPRRIPDHATCTLQPLSKKDWESMLYVLEQGPQSVIKVLRKAGNKPVRVSRAFHTYKDRANYPRCGLDVGGMNTTFRQKKLPYRVKISDLPANGNEEARLVQVLMMPSQNGSTFAQ